MAKSYHASFSAPSSRHTTYILSLVHSSLWRPAPVLLVSGHHYTMTSINNKSRLVWAFFLKHKSLFKAFAAFKEWLVFVEKETGCQLLTSQFYGGEFILMEWIRFMKD
jgi:hypothetical protein